MAVELDRAGLTFAPAGPVELFPAVRPADAAGFANRGYHGCFRSHYEIVEAARRDGLRNVLVMEDDLAISPNFRRDEASLVARLQQDDWSFAFLGHILEPAGDRPTELRPFAEPLLLTHFYALHARVFDRLLAFLEAVLSRPAGHPDGGPMSPDAAFSFFRARNRDLLTLVASPNLGWQRSSRSDLTPRWFDKVPGLRGMAASLRKAKGWVVGR